MNTAICTDFGRLMHEKTYQRRLAIVAGAGGVRGAFRRGEGEEGKRTGWRNWNVRQGLENVKAYTVSARSCKMGDTESKIPNGKSI